jgi:hypothetical protein
MMPSQVERFWDRVDIRGPDECWLWRGAKHAHGYGQLVRKKKRLYAHRVAYELFKGPIPDGFEIDHVKAWGCNDRSCCNPFHLEAITSEENKLRSDWPPAVNARKTICKRGHSFSSANTGYSRNGRYCKACHRIQIAESRKKIKQLRLEADYAI